MDQERPRALRRDSAWGRGLWGWGWPGACPQTATLGEPGALPARAAFALALTPPRSRARWALAALPLLGLPPRAASGSCKPLPVPGFTSSRRQVLLLESRLTATVACFSCPSSDLAAASCTPSLGSRPPPAGGSWGASVGPWGRHSILKHHTVLPRRGPAGDKAGIETARQVWRPFQRGASWASASTQVTGVSPPHTRPGTRPLAEAVLITVPHGMQGFPHERLLRRYF